MSQKIEEHKVPVYLVNTGWIGGSATSGAKRISIKFTRKMITSILDGTIEKSKYKTDPIFNLDIPVSIDGIPSQVLNPRDAWEDKSIYDSKAELSNLFKVNFNKYGDSIEYLKEFGPK